MSLGEYQCMCSIVCEYRILYVDDVFAMLVSNGDDGVDVSDLCCCLCMCELCVFVLCCGFVRAFQHQSSHAPALCIPVTGLGLTRIDWLS